jgi:hypothetical protein
MVAGECDHKFSSELAERNLGIKKIAGTWAWTPLPCDLRCFSDGRWVINQPESALRDPEFLTMSFDVGDDILDGFYFFRVLVGNLHLIFLFERHHQLDDV